MSFLRISLAACSLALSATVAAESSLVLEEAWVRALPPTQPNTAAYLKIVNPGSRAVEIVSARSPVAGRVEFHTTREVYGYVRMEPLAKLQVAAGQTLELAPGGTHLMLLDLSAMPVPGDTVSICLKLATGGDICTDAPVRRDAGTDTQQHHHH